MPKISVIVPVYNVEKYLERCVDSIVHQSFSDIEIILVDDGSTDLSSKICDDLAQQDKRITVVHKINGGLSSARNAGLDISCGEYVGFVDSDDWIDSQMYENLYTFCVEENLDIAVCSVLLAYENDEKKTYYSCDERLVMNRSDAFENMFVQHKFGFEAWNKLYKREVFHNIRYPLGRLFEDGFVICSLIHNCERIGYLPFDGYYYFQRESSIMHRKSNLMNYDSIDSANSIISYLRSNENDVYQQCMGDFLMIPLRNGREIVQNNSLEAKKYFNKVQKYLKNYRCDFLRNEYIPQKIKLLLLGVSISRNITKVIYRTKDIFKR